MHSHRMRAAGFTGVVLLLAGSGPAAATVFDYTGAVQTTTLSQSGLYRITATGASGGYGRSTLGGHGATAAGTVALAADTSLSIIVGGRGGSATGQTITWPGGEHWPVYGGGGGGGGSFVITYGQPAGNAIPLVIAGGGGGGGYNTGAGFNAVPGAQRGGDASAGNGGFVPGGGSAARNAMGAGGGGGGFGLAGQTVFSARNGGAGGSAAIAGAAGGAGAGSTLGLGDRGPYRGGNGGFGGGGGGGAAVPQAGTSEGSGGGGGGYAGGAGGVANPSQSSLFATYGSAGGGGGSFVASGAGNVAFGQAPGTLLVAVSGGIAQGLGFDGSVTVSRLTEATWSPGSDGSWSTAGNFSYGGMASPYAPAPGDTITIAPGAPGAPQTIGGTVTNQGVIQTDGHVVFTGQVTGAGGFGGTGTVEIAGGLHVGNSPAQVTEGVAMLFDSTATLSLDLGGTTPGTCSGVGCAFYGQVTFNADVTFGGTLLVNLYNGFVPSAGDDFRLFVFNSTHQGTFAALNLPALLAGLSWDTSALYTTGDLRVVGGHGTGVPEPAGLGLLGLALVGLAAKRR